jgi:hypothetical protein
LAGRLTAALAIDISGAEKKSEFGANPSKPTM